MIYTFEAKLRNMEHEIGNISIARIASIARVHEEETDEDETEEESSESEE